MDTYSGHKPIIYVNGSPCSLLPDVILPGSQRLLAIFLASLFPPASSGLKAYALGSLSPSFGANPWIPSQQTAKSASPCSLQMRSVPWTFRNQEAGFAFPDWCLELCEVHEPLPGGTIIKCELPGYTHTHMQGSLPRGTIQV